MNLGILNETVMLEKLVNYGIEKSKNINQKVLVSHIERLEDINVFCFLNNNISHFVKENFYWEDSSSEFFIAGLGTVKTINVMNMDNRYKTIKEEWRKVTDCAVIKNPYPEIDGIGPVLFGGFSFDNVKEDSNLWDKFGNGLFFLPKYMVTKVNGQSYFTTNIICTADGIKDQNINQLLQERKHILQNAKIHSAFQFTEKRLPFKVEEKNSESWKNQVSKSIEMLKNDYAKKVVLARELHLTYNENINYMSVLKNLIDQQKSSYIFSMTSETDCFIGATPERLVKKEDKRMFSSCVAGSAPRGKTVEADNQIKAELLADTKNLDEHQYVVDMITSAFEKLCESVGKANSPQIMTNKDIHHLYTPVEGWIKDGVSIFDFVKELHPTPALGGTPTEIALQMIRDLELFERGMYAGPIGWVDYRENGEFVVAIRSALLKGCKAVLFAGCGIVKNSFPDKEYEETKVKFRPMLRALGGNVDE